MKISNVLFIAEGQLGDLLLLTPALRAMKETYPSASLSVLVLERHQPAHLMRLRNEDRDITPDSLDRDDSDQLVVESSNNVLLSNPNVDKVYILNRNALRSLARVRRARAEFQTVSFLRSKKFDAAICTFPEDRFALWAFASGAQVRVGQKKQGFSWLLTRTPEIEKSNKGVLEYYCDLVRIIGAKVTSARTEYIIPESARSWADEFLRKHGLNTSQKLVAVHPGASGDYKIWPPDRFASLIDCVQTDLGVPIILCYGRGDEAVVDEIKPRLKKEVIEVNVERNVGNLAAIFKLCWLCILNDSGPRHLAVAVGVPSLAFFRQHHDIEWKIYPENESTATLQAKQPCSACPAGMCKDKIPAGDRFGSHCVRMISVEQAVARVRKLLFASSR